MRLLTVDEILTLQRVLIDKYGGLHGVRDLGLVSSAVAQPHASFAGEELYPTLVEKAAAVGYSLIKNHAFLDGNKRIGFAALDTTLRLNGSKLQLETDEAEQTILAVTSSTLDRDALIAWIQTHCVPLA